MSVLEKIDKNYTQNWNIDSDLKEYKIPCEPFTIFGSTFYEGEGFHKMPLDYVKSLPLGPFWGSKMTTGVRITFSTDATKMAISATLYDFIRVAKSNLLANNGFRLVELTDSGEEVHAANFNPPQYKDGGVFMDDSFASQSQLRGGMRNYILYLPTYSGVNEMSIFLDENATVKEFNPYSNLKPILFYGNSITQGACATRPDTNFACIICNKTKTDIINYSLSGGARANPEHVEYLKTVDCSVFICDYDANADSSDFLRKTHLPLYKSFRETHPETPIILLTLSSYFRDNFWKNGERAKRDEVIFETYKYAIENGDKNIYLIKGKDLIPRDLREMAFNDESHPNDIGHYFIANRVLQTLNPILQDLKEKGTANK